MKDEDNWDDLVAGIGCPLCAPDVDDDKDRIKVAGLSVATLYVDRNQTYRGYCVLVFNKRHVTGLDQLSDSEYQHFTVDLRRAMLAITRAVQPDHMNYVMLGNLVPHLHCHIFPRYKNDPRWRQNPFAELPPQPLASNADYDVLVQTIRQYL